MVFFFEKIKVKESDLRLVHCIFTTVKISKSFREESLACLL